MKPKRIMFGLRDPFKEFEREFEVPWLTPWLPRFAREPFLDVFEAKDEVVVTAELPGVKKEDIKIRVSENGLSLKIAEHEKRESEKKEEGFYSYKYASRFEGYSQFVSFPCAVEASKARASFKNGVLEVRVPKKELGEGRELRVE